MLALHNEYLCWVIQKECLHIYQTQMSHVNWFEIQDKRDWLSALGYMWCKILSKTFHVSSSSAGQIWEPTVQGFLKLIHFFYMLTCFFVSWESNWVKWRTNHQLLVQHFWPMTESSMWEYQIPVIEAESTQLLTELMNKPEQIMQHPMRFTSSVMMSLGMDWPVSQSQWVSRKL